MLVWAAMNNIKGEQREAKRLKKRYGMRVSGASIRRIQMALLERAKKKAEKNSRKH